MGKRCRIVSKSTHPLEKEAKLFCSERGTGHEQSQNRGNYCKAFSLANRLGIRPSGWFHIEAIDNGFAISIYRDSGLAECIPVATLAEANRLRMPLSDQGMPGLFEYSL